MAKSTEQKRLEAIERARNHLGRHRENWQDAIANKHDVAKRFGNEWANRHMDDACKSFLRSMQHSQSDQHGNPATGVALDKASAEVLSATQLAKLPVPEKVN